MSRLGPGDMNVPFEPNPVAVPVDLQTARLSGGLVVMAASVPVPDVGPCPALVFRFATPHGEFYDPMILVVDEDDLLRIPALIGAAVAAASQASRP